MDHEGCDPYDNPYEPEATPEDIRQDTERQRLYLGLRAWATGDTYTEAAVDLLIWHQEWLRREDFLEHVYTRRTGEEGCQFYVDWSPIFIKRVEEKFTASSSALTVLDVALGLTVGDCPFPLTKVGGLDVNHTVAVTQALVTAAGHRHRVKVSSYIPDEELPPFLRGSG